MKHWSKLDHKLPQIEAFVCMYTQYDTVYIDNLRVYTYMYCISMYNSITCQLQKIYMYENYTTQQLKSQHIPLMLTLRSWWPCVRGSKSNEPKGHATTAVGVQIGSFRKKKSTSRVESPLRSWQTIFLWVSATVKSLGVAILCTIFCTIVSAKHALKRLHLKSVARIDLKLTGFRGSQCTFCRTAWIGMIGWNWPQFG